MAKAKQDLRDFIIERLKDVAETADSDALRMEAIRLLIAAIPPRGEEREQSAPKPPTPTPTVRQRLEQEERDREEYRRQQESGRAGRTCGHGGHDVPQDVPSRRVPRVE